MGGMQHFHSSGSSRNYFLMLRVLHGTVILCVHCMGSSINLQIIMLADHTLGADLLHWQVNLL